MSAKPITDNIRSVRMVDEHGDLRPALDVAGDKLAEVVNAVTATGKAGSLTLKIDIKSSTAGALAVKAEVKITKPKGIQAESLLWPTPDGNLLEDDPRQVKLELRPVATEPARELKTITA